MSKTLKANFEIEGKSTFFGDAMDERLATAEFVNLYNEAVELENPKIEEWNKEFNQMYPEHVIVAEDPNDLYNLFFAQKMRTICEIVNKRHYFKTIELDVGEGPAFIGVGVGLLKGITIRVWLEWAE